MRAAGAISYTYAELAANEPAFDEVRASLGLPADSRLSPERYQTTTRILQIRAEYGPRGGRVDCEPARRGPALDR